MFEIKVKPEVKDTPQTVKTPDSVLIVRQIKRSGTKAMRACLNDLENGTKVLDINKKFVDARHGKVLINYVGTTIGSHTGPGTVALFFWGERKL